MKTPKSERLKIREMELEYELQMQREKMIGDFVLTPPGCYLIGLYGSILIEYLGAVMTPKEKRTKSMEETLAEGAALLLGGPTLYAAREYFSGDGNPLAGLFKMAGAGGAALFTALLILNEMKPDGSGSQGGAMGAMLGMI